MFRALFAHPQEVLYQRHLVYCCVYQLAVAVGVGVGVAVGLAVAMGVGVGVAVPWVCL
jgi:hypothetical protein